MCLDALTILSLVILHLFVKLFPDFFQIAQGNPSGWLYYPCKDSGNYIWFGYVYPRHIRHSMNTLPAPEFFLTCKAHY